MQAMGIATATLVFVAWPLAAEHRVFVDATGATGLDFTAFTGATGKLHFPEIMGAGGALFDYDGDGDLDLFLVQGTHLDPAHPAEGGRPSHVSKASSDRLYRNDLTVGADGVARVSFVDVTAASGLAGERGYGMGATVGDVDRDGHPDLYVTNVGSNRLWRNRGDGTFDDVTTRAGADDPRWSVAAAFFDYDRDGHLDLYVGNYVAWSLAAEVPCIGPSGIRDYCGPATYAAVPDRLLRNRGDGTFEDTSGRSGIGAKPGPGLGAAVVDVDGDGWLDLFVANDGAPNVLWRNRGDGTFEEEALLRGVALNAAGKTEAGMGVAHADLDGDADFDLFVTHLDGETNTLYVDDGDGYFRDATLASGLGPPSLPRTGFGAVALDLERDGRPDLAVVNGAVKAIAALAQARDPFPYHQPNQLFANLGGGRFREVTAPLGGETFTRSRASRAALAGDLDNDGDLDLVVTTNGGPAEVLLNQGPVDAAAGNGWLGLRLLAPTGGGGRDGPGAVGTPRGYDLPGTRVEVQVPGRAPLVAQVQPATGYAGANDPRVLLGLGPHRGPVAVRVRWPDGLVERFPAVASGRYTTLLRGSGQPDDAGRTEGARR